MKDKIFMGILASAMFLFFALCVYSTISKGVKGTAGHWAPEYQDSLGVLHDVDGDGDFYYWVEE